MILIRECEKHREKGEKEECDGNNNTSVREKQEMKRRREVLLIDMLVRDGKEKHGLYKGV